MSRILLGDDLVLPKTAGKGIMVDHSDPSYGWVDLIGPITPKIFGAGSPTRTTFRGNIAGSAVIANDIVDLEFHIPHDYYHTLSDGTSNDLYFHVHQGHNGTNISGTAEWTCYTTYAKRDTGAFPAEIAPVITYATVNLTTTPQYQHLVHEIQLSAASPSVTQIDTNDIEVDGLIKMAAKLTTLPTVTGGSWFVFFFDIHYRSIFGGTKQRASPFWT